MKVKIKLCGGKMPERHGEWYDLSTAEDVVMRPGELRYISLGVAMQLPPGYYAQIVPRSSTPKNYGVIMANSVGVIGAVVTLKSVEIGMILEGGNKHTRGHIRKEIRKKKYRCWMFALWFLFFLMMSVLDISTGVFFAFNVPLFI